LKAQIGFLAAEEYRMTFRYLAGLLLIAVAAAGCTPSATSARTGPTAEEMVAALAAVQKMYGPPQNQRVSLANCSDPIACDFNGDGCDEILLFFGAPDEGKPEIRSLDNLRNNLHHIGNGFLLLTLVDGHYWPLFYYSNESRCSITYRTEAEWTGLWAEGGKDGVQIFWGWQQGAPDRFNQWLCRERVSPNPWLPFPPVLAEWGK
jgi:hypothetical protein